MGLSCNECMGGSRWGALGAVAPLKPHHTLKVLSCNKPEFNRHCIYIESLQWGFPDHVKIVIRHFEWIDQ